MNITVLRETEAGEARVALMPDSVQKLIAAKASVAIESGAQTGATLDGNGHLQRNQLLH